MIVIGHDRGGAVVREWEGVCPGWNHKTLEMARALVMRERLATVPPLIHPVRLLNEEDYSGKGAW